MLAYLLLALLVPTASAAGGDIIVVIRPPDDICLPVTGCIHPTCYLGCPSVEAEATLPDPVNYHVKVTVLP